MKVGSKVICVKNAHESLKKEYGFYGIVFPIKGAIYTVRTFDFADGKYCIRLDELVNPSCDFIDGFYEPRFVINGFREIDTPPELSEFTEYELIEELELTPQTA